jgi:hypothetical protein
VTGQPLRGSRLRRRRRRWIVLLAVGAVLAAVTIVGYIRAYEARSRPIRVIAPSLPSPSPSPPLDLSPPMTESIEV